MWKNGEENFVIQELGFEFEDIGDDGNCWFCC